MGLRILLVDDNSFYKKGFSLMLKRLQVVDQIYEVASGIEFLNKVETICPDIIFMDIKMPDMDGIEASQKALERNSKLKIIALTMFIEDSYLHQMILAGAKGYLLKDAGLSEAKEAIENVHKGLCYFSDRVVKPTK